VHDLEDMWNKDSNLTPAASPQPARPVNAPAAPAESFSVGDGALIGETMRIKGEVFSKDELRLDGEMVGKLESLNRLTVGVKGKAEATIKAAEVVIAGAVTGNVEATQRIVLRKGANLVGDVKTAGIVIEDGAFFRGGIDIAQPEVAKTAAR
jgi:cytoskeletal protein CcmA (bactofilin family)